MSGTATIPELPSATALDGTEPFETVQGGASVKATINQVASFITDDASGITSLTGDVTATGPGQTAASVVRLRGRNVSSTAPMVNEVLTWDGTEWLPAPGGGTASSITTLAELRALVFPSANSTVTTGCRTTPGDNGGGIWTARTGDQSDNVTDDPESGIWVAPDSDATGASGAWERVWNGALEDAWFGVKADGSTDDSDALQAAIYYSMYIVMTMLWLSFGTIVTTRSMNVGYGQDFRSAYIKGRGKKYGGESNFVGTTIDTTSFGNAPAFAVQGLREAVIEDIHFTGANYAYLLDANPMSPGSQPDWDDTVAANWIDPAVLADNPNMFSQYAPYCAIAIDPYSGDRPSPSYPDVDYPGPPPTNPEAQGVGIANLTAPIDGGGQFIGVDDNGMAAYGGDDGGVYINGDIVTPDAAEFGIGVPVDVFVDVDNQNIYYRVDDGDWSDPTDFSAIAGDLYLAVTLRSAKVGATLGTVAITIDTTSTMTDPPISGGTPLGGTLNPADIGAGMVLSGGNLVATVVDTGFPFINARGDTIITGKKYYRYTLTTDDLDPQYSKLTSSGVTLRRISSDGYVIGVVNQPGDSDSNGDFVKLIEVDANYAVWHTSIGTSQSRSTDILDCQANVVFTPFTNSTHGRQRGKFGGTITNFSANQCKAIFDFDTAWLGPLTFINFYMESTWEIGYTGGFSVNCFGITFEGGEFNFNNYEPRGISANMLTGAATCLVQFNNCAFGAFPDVISFNTSRIMPSLDGCLFNPIHQPNNTAKYISYNTICAGALVVLREINQDIEITNARYQRLDTDGSESGVYNSQLPVTWALRASPTAAYAKAIAPYLYRPITTYAVPIYRNIWSISKTTGGLASVLVEKTLTMTFGTYSAYEFAVQGPLPGDIVVDPSTGSAFRVDSKASQVITATLLNNFKLVDAAYETIESFALDSGTWLVYNSRSYVLTDPAFGTWTAAGNVVAITDGQGGNILASNADRRPAAKDFLVINPNLDNFADAEGCKVDTIDTGAGTVTFTASNFAATVTVPKLLPIWVRWTGD